MTMADLGRSFGGLLYEREAVFLQETEWAVTAADVLQRRTKHGLHMSEAETQAFAVFMAAGRVERAPEPSIAARY